MGSPKEGIVNEHPETKFLKRFAAERKAQRSKTEPKQEQEIIWQARPSQLTNLPFLAKWALIGIVATVVTQLLVPFMAPLVVVAILGRIAWRMAETAVIKFELKHERLAVKYGLLNRTEESMELYRIRDYMFHTPLYLRVFGFGQICLESSDKTTPELWLKGIKGGRKLIEQMRLAVEDVRKKKGVRTLDVD